MLAWSQSYVLLGLVRMYETYKDPYYLDRLIENVDQVLSVRDSERGVTDYRGLSLPAWRSDHPYTVGFTTLADGNGRSTLEVRSALTFADDTTVTVLSGSRPDTFTLRAVNGTRTMTVSDLSMDPASPDYVVSRIYAAPIGTLMLTVRDVRDNPAAAGTPALGDFPLLSKPAIFAVHTGMITYPIASFVRIVPGVSPAARKRKVPGEGDGVPGRGAAAAVAVHDWEYRETSTSASGHLIWPKSQPLAYDGCEQPINQSVGLGQTLVELAIVTGDRGYRRTVRRCRQDVHPGSSLIDAGGAYSGTTGRPTVMSTRASPRQGHRRPTSRCSRLPVGKGANSSRTSAMVRSMSSSQSGRSARSWGSLVKTWSGSRRPTRRMSR